MIRACWVLIMLIVPLFGGEATPAPVRYGIDRDGYRVTVDVALPRLTADQRRPIETRFLARLPGFVAGMDVADWVKDNYTTMINEMSRGQAEFPGAASFTGWYHESVISTSWYGGDLLSLHAEHNSYSGGVHPGCRHEALLFDSETMKPVTLADLIAPADQDAFATLLIERWKQTNHLLPDARPSEHGLFKDELPPALPLITAAGIEVIYSPYEVAPWSTGTVRITLTRDQARPFLRRDPWGK